MLHACVRTFDVTGTVENFLGTKQGLSVFRFYKNLDIIYCSNFYED